MSRSLKFALTATDLAFLAYWCAALLNLVGLIHIPPEWMYADYRAPQVVAWNWSFLPVDLAFSGFGLAAVWAARRQDRLWRPLCLVSLVLTQVAGLMAVAYWTLLGQFNLAWFLPNLALVLWPFLFLPNLICAMAETGIRS